MKSSTPARPTVRPAPDADRIREPRSGHQGVDGRAGQRGHRRHVSERENSCGHVYVLLFSGPASVAALRGQRCVLRSRTMTADEFRRKLQAHLTLAQDRGELHVDINAGELHRRVGRYPGSKHRMPVCCSVLRSEMVSGDEVITEPQAGQGASLTVRYRLPRPSTRSLRPLIGEAEDPGQ